MLLNVTVVVTWMRGVCVCVQGCWKLNTASLSVVLSFVMMHGTNADIDLLIEKRVKQH